MVKLNVPATVKPLNDGFSRTDFMEVLAYTAPDNLRSRAVMGSFASLALASA
jgi:hypothetical protein